MPLCRYIIWSCSDVLRTKTVKFRFTSTNSSFTIVHLQFVCRKPLVLQLFHWFTINLAQWIKSLASPIFAWNVCRENCINETFLWNIFQLRVVLIYLFLAILRGMVLLIDVNLSFPTGSKVRFDDQFKCRLRPKQNFRFKVKTWLAYLWKPEVRRNMCRCLAYSCIFPTKNNRCILGRLFWVLHREEI